jgi:hypothetical protein
MQRALDKLFVFCIGELAAAGVELTAAARSTR